MSMFHWITDATELGLTCFCGATLNSFQSKDEEAGELGCEDVSWKAVDNFYAGCVGPNERTGRFHAWHEWTLKEGGQRGVFADYIYELTDHDKGERS